MKLLPLLCYPCMSKNPSWLEDSFLDILYVGPIWSPILPFVIVVDSFHQLAVCEHAYSIAQNLDPNSEGRGVLQFKTGLMSVIKVCIPWTPFFMLYMQATDSLYLGLLVGDYRCTCKHLCALVMFCMVALSCTLSLCNMHTPTHPKTQRNPSKYF